MSARGEVEAGGRGGSRFDGRCSLGVAWAITGSNPCLGFNGLGGANSKKPIDIESDRLEVDDKKHVAIFSGNVSATQGDYNLRAPRLEVTYDKSADAAPQEHSGASSGAESCKDHKGG